MSEVKPNSPYGQGNVYGQMGGPGMHGNHYVGNEMYGYGCGTMPMGYGNYPNQAPIMQGSKPCCGTPHGYGGGWSSMGTILVLFILLVIISKTMFI